MLLLIMKGLTIPEDSRSSADKYFNEVVEEISKLLQPMIKTLRAEQAQVLGVNISDLGYNAAHNPPYTENFFVDCEIFISNDYLLILSLENDQDYDPSSAAKSPTLVCISYIGASLEYEAALRHIGEVVQSKFKTPVEQFYYRNPRFDEIRSEATTEQIEISDIDPTSAEVLSQDSYRKLATTIKRSVLGLPLADAAKQLHQENREEAGAIKDKLIHVGLVSTEFVVICAKSNSHVIKVDRPERLMEFASKGLKCACGKLISEEDPRELLTITQNGRLLLDKSRWMSILLKQRLEALGVRPDDILLECQIGGNEIDCIANINGELVMFELKDKEFELGNAYPLSTKIGLVEPHHTVIITTARVGKDVKELFKRFLGTPRRRRSRQVSPSEETSTITYIEGMENFQAELDKLVSDIYGRGIRKILIDALSFITAGPDDLIRRVT